jgi:2-keto-4-pentenoate hydratase/2-oxohepta-3-ene-1,7-dioic acid hydratase in catechol pathway
MRAVRVESEGHIFAGIEDAGRVWTIPEDGLDPIAIIAANGWATLRRRATMEVAPGRGRFLAPLSKPGKILCVGLNYWDHVQEQGLHPPDHPILFAKMPSALIGPGDPIPLHGITTQTDYEAELAIVIGKRSHGVSKEKALDFVAGYTVLNDVSARDIQRSDGQWVRSKSLDGYAPLGPALVSTDEVGDASILDIRSYVNGELRQDSNTKNLIFDVTTLVAFCSEAMTLEPGDVIATGTPAGVGVFMKPPRFLQAGDVVTIVIEGIGELSNPVEVT